MKKIGIDARLYSQTGVGVYLRNLLFFLQKSANQDIIFYVYLTADDYHKVFFKKDTFIKKLAVSRWHSFSEQTAFFKELYNDNLDLMHFTYFSYPILYKRKFIVTVHDTTPLLFKTGKASTKNPMVYAIKHLLFRFVLSTQIKNSQLIITPTNYVKDQITALFGQTYEKKITTIHEGVSFELMNSKQNDGLKKRFTKDFMIYVGNFYPHKNVEKLIEAFAKIKTNSQLILIGPNNYFSQRLFQLINKLKQEKRIVFYHNATSEDLVFFYKNALGLINPSLSEGFGLPLIEAAYFNLPILASTIPVFEELMGDNYLKFNQNNIKDMTLKINQFLKQSPKFNYQNIIQNYSFVQMTNQTLALYNKLLE